MNSASASSPGGLWTRTPCHTPLIPAPHLQPLLRRQLQLAFQIGTGFFAMNEITEAEPHTPVARVKPTTRLAKISHGRQFTINRFGSIPPTVERITCLLSRILVLEPCVHISNQMVIVVVAYHHLFHFPVLAHLAPKVFVEGVEVVLKLGWVHFVLGVVGWVLVQVG